MNCYSSLIFPITQNIVLNVAVDKLHQLITLNIEYLESKNFAYNYLFPKMVKEIQLTSFSDGFKNEPKNQHDYPWSNRLRKVHSVL